MRNVGGNHFFILEDELLKGRGYDNPPRNTILTVLKRHKVTYALTPEEAKKKYDPNAGYSHLLLDHDMEGFHNHDLSYPNTGLNFVQWLVKLALPVPIPEVFIHTQNSKGRDAMTTLLVASGYKRINHTPYGPDFIKMLQERFI